MVDWIGRKSRLYGYWRWWIIMADRIQNRFQPDYVIPPGETLLETLESIGMTQDALAKRAGRSAKSINRIIKGEEPITSDTALRFERVLGVPASFWGNLERNYREGLARIEECNKLAAQVSWLRNIPLREMIARKWIRAFPNKTEQLREVLNFFGVVSPMEWEKFWRTQRAAFRHAPSFESDPFALATWLWKGELEAQQIQCADYDYVKFQNVLISVRELTMTPPEQFQVELQELCSAAGVAVVFVPLLKGARVSGATRWISSKKAMIQLSLRYKRDDQFWFSFYHEAFHILHSRKKAVFIDVDGAGVKAYNEDEEKIDRLAQESLIPRRELERFLTTWNKSKKDIEAFAEHLGIAAGIVVGRLQHDGVLSYEYCNGLKRRFEWS